MRHAHRVELWLALAVLSLGLLLHRGTIESSDGISMYEVSRSLVDRADVAIDRGVVWHGADGRFYSPFGLGLSLLAVIPYAAVALARHLLPISEQAAEAAVAGVMPVVFACLAAATYALARRLSAQVRSSILVAAGAVGGTFAVVYAKDFFSEPLAALCVVVAIERALAKRWTMSGAALGAAVITRPQFLALAPLMLWRSHRAGGWSASARALVPVALGLLVDVGYNVIRFADPLNFGYSTPELPQGFTTPFLDGAAGLLINPEKSVLLFAPLVALILPGVGRLWSRARDAFWLVGGNLAITFVLSATWWAWGGGWVWGPRLLIPALFPAFASIAAWVDGGSKRRAGVAVFLIALGAALNAPGVLVDPGAQLSDRPRPPDGPRIERQLALLPIAAQYTASHIYDHARSDGPSLDLWQVKAARQWGPPGLLAALLGSGLLLAALVGCVALLVNVVRQSGWRTSRPGSQPV